MNIKDVLKYDQVDFHGIEPSYFLIGLLSAFDNRFQSIADKLIGQISWKQFFTIICIDFFKEKTTIKD